jgi:DNA-binding GntR family transcriptional regulator
MTFNPKLETMGLELCSRLQLVRSHSGSQGERAIEALREHEEIFKALRNRDPDRAEEKARRHMRNALENLTQMTPVLKQ